MEYILFAIIYLICVVIGTMIITIADIHYNDAEYTLKDSLVNILIMCVPVLNICIFFWFINSTIQTQNRRRKRNRS